MNRLPLVKYLDDYEILYFKLNDLSAKLPSAFSNINELIENLKEISTYMLFDYNKTQLSQIHVPKC